ncbi:acyl carrier protein [Streptomyces albidoflavus]
MSEEDLRPDADKEAAGLDSLGLVELSMVLSKRFGIEVGDDELMGVTTLAEMARLMEERASQT